jgi:hypothetical protein
MSSFVDGFKDVLGTLSESYAEVINAKNSKASASQYTQVQPAVEPTQESISGQSASWLANNWLAIVAVVLAFILLIALLVWIL